jgi:hypothetical protein
MIQRSKEHLEESKTNYISHFTFAVYAGVLLILAGLASIIHAIIPGVLRGSAAYVVIKLYKDRLENHPNPQYRKWVSSNKKL